MACCSGSLFSERGNSPAASLIFGLTFMEETSHHWKYVFPVTLPLPHDIVFPTLRPLRRFIILLISRSVSEMCSSKTDPYQTLIPQGHEMFSISRGHVTELMLKYPFFWSQERLLVCVVVASCHVSANMNKDTFPMTSRSHFSDCSMSEEVK